MKYMGMATQMAVVTGIGVFAGKQLDAYMGNEKPYFTLLFAVIAITAVLYIILKDLISGK